MNEIKESVNSVSEFISLQCTIIRLTESLAKFKDRAMHVRREQIEYLIECTGFVFYLLKAKVGFPVVNLGEGRVMWRYITS
jgi:hypothetical protein